MSGDDFIDLCETEQVDIDSVEYIKSCMIDDGDALLLSEVFKVLGDPTRIKIIYSLSKKELCVCDIAAAIGMTQSAVSHQLRLLRGLRLVKFRKEGKMVVYSLDDEHILRLFSQGMEHIQHG
jgi:DNA-binding transcriptional ArsR family regulator